MSGPTQAAPHLAGAPVSFGVWGPHTGPADGTPRQVLAAIAAAGHRGTELGPPGYLGDERETTRALGEERLRPAGVYVGVHLDADGLLDPDRDELVRACGALRAAREAADRAGLPGPAPVLVLADAGAPHLDDAPRDPDDRASGLPAAAWARAVQVLAAAEAVAAEHGLPAAVHPHLATWVESAWEVERLLETTGLQLVLDTGHLLLAGADPLESLRAWRSRVAHVHLKDVSLVVAAQARQHGPVPLRSWWSRANLPLGEGDVDLAGVVAHLLATGYDGWLVLERDVEPAGGPELAEMAAAQVAEHRTVERLLGAAR